jgi:hypothetical protein
VTSYYLFKTFVKKPETALDLKKEYVYINIGTGDTYETFYVAPDAKFKIKLLRGKEVIYDQFYTANKFMFRGPENKKPDAKKHAIFGGCSFTWGDGLENKDTFSSQFQLNTSEYQSYNHSFPGGGLHTLLRYDDFYHLNEGVQEKEGYFFYTFIPTHMERFFLRYNFLRLLPELVPYYKVENGNVNYKGIVRDQKVYQTFKIAYDKGLGDTLINTQDPNKWEQQDLADYVLAVNYLKSSYLNQFPKGKFIFLFHPLGNPPGLKEDIKFHLKARNIEFIDLAHEYGIELMNAKKTYDDMFIPYDGHPNAIANELAGKALATHLQSHPNLK